MRVLIIDDELNARLLLEGILKDFCPSVTQISQAENLTNGVKAIREEKPDVVLLDVEMPRYSGLQLLDFMDESEINFSLIFITAYSEYAIEAFNLNALSYLLKPVNPTEVRKALQKAVKQKEKIDIQTQLLKLKEVMQPASLKKISLPIDKGMLFVELDDIVLIEADRMYCKVITKSQGELLISRPLKFFTDKLRNSQIFYQSHRSFLINLKHVKQYVRQDGAVMMTDNVIASISKDKREEFLDLVQSVI
jgi:two-component system LytT family response regulator